MNSTCSRCGHANLPENKFCSRCGGPLSVSANCSRCGASLNPDDRFCGKCGAPVQEATAQLESPAAPPIPARNAPTQAAELRSYHGHASPVTCVTVSPDGRTVLSGDRRGGLRLWDADTGRERSPLAGHKAEITALAFSPTGQYALSGSGVIDPAIRIWDTASGRELRRLSGHKDGVASAVFSPDGRSILSGGEDQSIRLWDVGSGFEMMRLTGHTHALLAVAFTPDGQRVLSAANDMTLRVWDLAGDRELRRFSMDPMYQDLVFDCAFAKDGSLALSTDPEGVQVWDMNSGRRLRTLAGHTGNIFGVTFSPDGGRALSCAGTDYYDEQLRRELGIDNTARLWDLQTGQELARLEGHGGNVNSVAFLAGGRGAVSAGSDCTVRVWSLPG